MARYIELDALVAEIDERLHQLTDAAFDSMIGRNLIEIKELAKTLEVKEVDLDFTKKVDRWIVENEDTNGFFNVQELAKHFFELGMNTSKGKQ